ncbi:MAG: hypothetical protein AB1403_25080 [Candidatus Riflebacteria bacterium]
MNNLIAAGLSRISDGEQLIPQILEEFEIPDRYHLAYLLLSPKKRREVESIATRIPLSDGNALDFPLD